MNSILPRACSDHMATHERRGSGSSPGRVEFPPTVSLPLLGGCYAVLVHHQHAAATAVGWLPLRFRCCARLLLQAARVLDLVLLCLNY